MMSQWIFQIKKKYFLFAFAILASLCTSLIFFNLETIKITRHKIINGKKFQNSCEALPLTSADDLIKTQLIARTVQVREECLRRNETKSIQLNSLKNTEFPWIYVSHKYEMLYCQIPKVGSTGWMKVVGAMEGRINGTSDSRPIHNVPLLLLSYLNHTERDRVIRDYTKIIMIRDPFERVVSAYRDKFLPRGGGSVFRKLAKEIVKLYQLSNRTVQAPASLRFQLSAPSFEEFIAYVTDPNNAVVSTHYSEPRHWQPQADLCFPCRIKYDHIIDISQVEKESNFVLASLGIPPNIRFPKLSKNIKHSKETSQYSKTTQEYFVKTNPRLVNKLYHYYKRDYEIFSFPVPPQF